MRLRVVLSCALGLLLTACPRQSSKEFHRLAADQEMLVARDGDEAWGSPEMAAIVSGLERVPERALERDRAVALVEKIKAEQARVETARALEASAAAAQQPASPPPAVVAPPLPAAGPGAEPEPTPDAPAADAGQAPPQPFLGMTEAQFTQRFGACVSRAAKTTLADGAEAAATYEVSATAECQQRLGGAQPGGRTVFLFGPKGLAEKATFVPQVMDGGQLVIPGRQPPTPDPGPPQLLVPGAPVPEGIDAGGIVPLP